MSKKVVIFIHLNRVIMKRFLYSPAALIIWCLLLQVPGYSQTG